MKSTASTSTARPVPRTIAPHKIAWEVLMPGVVRKKIWAEPMWNDPSVPREMSLMRYQPGTKVPLQKHVGGDEIVFVIEGVLSDEYGDLTAGNVAYRPEGCVHSLHSVNGATTMSYVVGGIKQVAEKPADSPPSRVINVNEMAWQSAEGGRVQMKVIWHDPVGKRRFVLGKLAPGFVMDPHEHVGEELVFQLEGSFVDEAGLLGPGDVGFRPFGCHHSFVSENGGVGLGYIWGHSDYLRDRK
jgi:anti-sigma factor ChrR (cupin superfamily)